MVIIVVFSQHLSEMQELKTIGKNIVSIRKRKGLTQEDLCGLADMDRSYLSEIENGHKNFSITVLLKMVEALETTPNKILKL